MLWGGAYRGPLSGGAGDPGYLMLWPCRSPGGSCDRGQRRWLLRISCVNTRAIAAATRGGSSITAGWWWARWRNTTETISWGILDYAFAAFLVPMQQELGWSTAALTGAYSLALLVSGLAAVPVGRWVDRHGSAPPDDAWSIGGAILLLAWDVSCFSPWVLSPLAG